MERNHRTGWILLSLFLFFSLFISPALPADEKLAKFYSQYNNVSMELETGNQLNEVNHYLNKESNNATDNHDNRTVLTNKKFTHSRNNKRPGRLLPLQLLT